MNDYHNYTFFKLKREKGNHREDDTDKTNSLSKSSLKTGNKISVRNVLMLVFSDDWKKAFEHIPLNKF